MSDPTGDVELPHNAWYDADAEMVCITLERCTFSFAVDEFFEFASEIDDVVQVLGQMVIVDSKQCDCGDVHDKMTVCPPSEEDFN